MKYFLYGTPFNFKWILVILFFFMKDNFITIILNESTTECRKSEKFEEIWLEKHSIN